MACDQWLADLDPFCVFLFSRFIACDGKSVIMIEGSKKCNCEGGFWTKKLAYLWKAQ